MANSLLALLSQQIPNLQTRKGLILTGLQNDFLSPEGKLPASTGTGFLDRLKEFVPAFREHGDVIWVRSHFKETRQVNQLEVVSDNFIVGSAAEDGRPNDDDDGSPVPRKRARSNNESTERPVTADDLIERIETGHAGLTENHDEDPELFLTETEKMEPSCIPGSWGAEYATQIKDLVDHKKDMEVVKTYYSAFGSTSLLLTLRSKLITELYICGVMTNLSVFATAMDAARYGIKVTLVEDCLGYRRKERHDLAIKQLHEIMEADIMNSTDVIERLKNPLLEQEEDDDDESFEDDEEVIVGEDAGGIPTDLLEADSDGDDDDLEPPFVRPSYISSRSLALRYAPSSAHGLPEASPAGPESSTPIEHSKPSNTGAPDTGYSTNDGRGAASSESTEQRGKGKRENNVERGLAGAASSSGVAADGDDSSSRGTSPPHMPWIDSIDTAWAERNRNLHITTGHSSHPGLNAMSAIMGLDQSTVNDMEDMMAEARLKNSQRETLEMESRPLFGDGKEEESAGSRISFDLLPPEIAATIFDELNHECKWQTMHHQTGEVPRLVCCQGTIGDDGSMPVYRHPSDQTLPIQSWTPAVDKVRKAAEKAVGHELNHTLIQLYRGGNDYISEHSDKTLDIVKGSYIVNVSFGAQRTMRLRTKKVVTGGTRTTHRVAMPHNSIITMSLPTNAEYLHGINADKRPAVELTEAEKALNGQRISLTFRNIGTFLNEDSSRIWGQGAVGKTKEEANAVINANAAASEKLVRAFGAENQSSQVDWDNIYGGGFDVLHLK